MRVKSCSAASGHLNDAPIVLIKGQESRFQAPAIAPSRPKRRRLGRRSRRTPAGTHQGPLADAPCGPRHALHGAGELLSGVLRALAVPNDRQDIGCELCRLRRCRGLPVHWQAHLPKRAREQAAIRLCGALLVSFCSTTAKRAGRRIGATVESLRKVKALFWGNPYF
jgi:hypothetical protein